MPDVVTSGTIIPYHTHRSSVSRPNYERTIDLYFREEHVFGLRLSNAIPNTFNVTFRRAEHNNNDQTYDCPNQ